MKRSGQDGEQAFLVCLGGVVETGVESNLPEAGICQDARGLTQHGGFADPRTP